MIRLRWFALGALAAFAVGVVAVSDWMEIDWRFDQ